MATLNKFANKFPSIIQEYTKEQIMKIFEKGKNRNQIAQMFGCKNNNYKIVERLCEYYNIDITQFWWYLHPRTPNLQGQNINNWNVLEYDNELSSKNKRTFWRVKCNCGNPNIYSISNDNLIHNKSTSCGKCNTYQMVGKTYGNLKVKSVAYWEKGRDGKTYPKVYATCTQCGSTKIYIAGQVRQRITKACNCFSVKSSGEALIAAALKELNIEYETQKIFDDLKVKSNLSYDFYLPKENILIEFQGQQHYKPIEKFGGQEQFERQIQHDKIKKDYAQKNNYRFLEISYQDQKSINKEFILNKIKEVMTP